MVERIAARLVLLRPLAYQVSVALSAALLVMTMLGIVGVLQALLGELASAWWPLLLRPRRGSRS